MATADTLQQHHSALFQPYPFFASATPSKNAGVTV